ncbi:MAG: hypothetical protein B6U69_03530 [Thermofilum sp. ex4484_15]|nr:MAG: hypothetical protein B6U69_03530 [Thermofilum sp. ex4484_15]
MDYERAVEECKSCEVIAYLPYELPHLEGRVFRGKLKDLIKEEVANCKGSVGLIGHFSFSLAREALRGKEIADLTDVLSEMRSVKEGWEVDNVKKAIEVAEEAIKEVLTNLREGLKEYEVASELIYEMRRRGAVPSFEPIVASGRNARFPHAIPSDKTIKSGELIVIDVGAKVNGYCSDITRTVSLGRLRTEDENLLKIVRGAQENAISKLREGIKASEVDREARVFIEKEGLGSYFIHSLGHGVGLEVHEYPLIAPDNDRPLKEGMIVTIEPGLYLKDKGVRIEDMYLVKRDKGERLTNLSSFIGL